MAGCGCPKCSTAGTIAAPVSIVPAAPPMPNGSVGSIGVRFSDLIQLKVGVKSPPELNSDVYEALRRLSEAHARAGSPLVVITDWYRTATDNLKTPRAAPTSQHLIGTAFDLRADGGGRAVAAEWARAGGEVIAPENYPEAPHWHLELASFRV